MACPCSYLTNFALDCTPTIGGVSSIVFKGAGAPPEGSTTPTDVTIETLPDSSTYNAVMTYDKQKNLKYWTTDVTLNIGVYNEDASALVEALPCHIGKTIELNMNSGHKVTVSDAYIQTATFTPGAAKTEGGDGILVFQAITKDAPSVTDPNMVI